MFVPEHMRCSVGFAGTGDKVLGTVFFMADDDGCRYIFTAKHVIWGINEAGWSCEASLPTSRLVRPCCGRWRHRPRGLRRIRKRRLHLAGVAPGQLRRLSDVS